MAYAGSASHGDFASSPFRPKIVRHDSFDDDDDYLDDSEFSDREELKPCSGDLNVTSNYIQSWSEGDAFRELFQNQKDAMIDKLGKTDKLDTNIESAGNNLIVRFYAHLHRNLLGYIRFNGRNGSLSLVNFDASLKRGHLKLGSSSKQLNEAAAGYHGEGGKLAIVVFLRRGRKVKYTASSHYWNFKLKHYMTRYTISKVRDQNRLRPADRRVNDLAHSARDDVCVVISAAGREGRRVTLGEVLHWLEVSYDFAINRHNVQPIAVPGKGDLVMGAGQPGTLFLKGLQVDTNGLPGELVFTYNLLHGNINRDRRLMNPNEVAHSITRIWRDAVRTNPGIVREYVNLFFSHEKAADIYLAEEGITLSMAVAIKEHLCLQKSDCFLFPIDKNITASEAIDRNIIINDLNKEPYAIPLPCWKILLRHKLVSTPRERKIELFKRSARIEDPISHFSQSILKCIRASLSLEPALANIKVSVVQGGGTSINMLFLPEKNGTGRAGEILIHENWFDFQRAHRLSTCEIAHRPEDPNLFACDHIIEDLAYQIVSEVGREPTVAFDHASSNAFLSMARENVRECARFVTVKPTGSPCQLKVKWKSKDSGFVDAHYGLDRKFIAVLHRSDTCEAELSAYINQNSPEHMPNGDHISCGCPYQLVAHSAVCEVVFSDLEVGSKYFAMVARFKKNSFWPHSHDHEAQSLAPSDAMRVRNAANDRAVSIAYNSDDDADDDGAGGFNLPETQMATSSKQASRAPKPTATKARTPYRTPLPVNRSRTLTEPTIEPRTEPVEEHLYCQGDCGIAYRIWDENDENIIVYLHKQMTRHPNDCKVLKSILEQQMLRAVPPSTAGHLRLSIRELTRADPYAIQDERGTIIKNEDDDTSDIVEVDVSEFKRSSKRPRAV